MLARFRAKGLTPVVATELEFYLYKPRDGARRRAEPPERSPDLRRTTTSRFSTAPRPSSTTSSTAPSRRASTPDTLIAEYGPGQFEINFHHTDDVLQAADDALVFRRLVRGIARRHGMGATFMAKPYADYPGNGMHAHVSLVDADGRNVFDDGSDGPSALLKQAVAGTLATMADLQADLCPAHELLPPVPAQFLRPARARLGARQPRRRGAPARSRRAPARGSNTGSPGADTNPYLVLAAILGGMLYGLENPDLPLPPAARRRGRRPCRPAHRRLGHGGRYLRRIRHRRRRSSATDYRDIYTAVRRDEIAQLTTAISQIEYRTYLGRL